MCEPQRLCSGSIRLLATAEKNMFSSNGLQVLCDRVHTGLFLATLSFPVPDLQAVLTDLSCSGRKGR